MTTSCFVRYGLPTPTHTEDYHGLGHAYHWVPSSVDSQLLTVPLPSPAGRFLDFATAPEPLAPLLGPFSEWLASLSTLLVVGTGGSSLGAKMLAELGDEPLCRLVFLDNVDPLIFNTISQSCDLTTTGALIVSKSGTTPETMAQFLALKKLYHHHGLDHHIPHLWRVITEPKDSPLMRLAQALGLEVYPHDLTLGGRFSCVSKVALLPGYAAGCAIASFQQGLTQGLTPLPAYIQAHNALYAQQAITQTVLMVYGDAWRHVPAWYMQLWAESLGKQGWGTTPLGSQGTQDQHSLLQLFLEGPRDKYYTLVIADDYGPDVALGVDQSSENYPQIDPALEYLSKATMADLFRAEAWATARTLVAKNLPVRILHLTSLNAQTLGAFVMTTMIETVQQAALWGIDPFDQPAVEEGKRLAKDFLRASAS